MRKILTLLLPLIIYIPFCQSATFCVTTNNELNAAMLTASVNNENDHIKIAEGTYVVEPGFLTGTFSYSSVHGDDLEISGGWSEFFGDLCGQNLGGSPFNTILSGDLKHKIMKILPGFDADLKISGLYFVNGAGPTVGEKSSGLEIVMFADSAGNLIVERNIFFNNSAFASAALSVRGGNRTDVKNNLFIGNTTASGDKVVNIGQNDGVGIYVINNTIMFNSGGLYVIAGQGLGTSQALVANNLLWGNIESDLEVIGNGMKYVKNNDIDVNGGIGSPNEQTNNISLPPLFEPGLLNFTPSVTSPLVSGGITPGSIQPIPTPFNANWNIGTNDNSGNLRLQGTKVDIGAYESPHQMMLSDLMFVDGFEE